MPATLLELFVSAVTSGLFLLVVVLWVILNRYLMIRRQSPPALVRLTWTLDMPTWRTYLARKIRSFATTLLIWFVLYAMIMAAISPQIRESFLERTLIYVAYSIIVIAPAALVAGAFAYVRPIRYTLGENGIGIMTWLPFLVRSGAGFLDVGFKPWQRIAQYRFEDETLLLKGSRGFMSQGIAELVVPPPMRQAVEEVLKERGLDKLKGPLVPPPRRPARKSAARAAGKEHKAGTAGRQRRRRKARSR